MDRFHVCKAMQVVSEVRFLLKFGTVAQDHRYVNF